ncbi:MAG: hypothetical protein ACFFAI_01870 [Promethearchaeota archaeon]
MPVCSRCGAKIDLQQEYCSVCGLHQDGGKGKLLIPYKPDIYKLKKFELRYIEIPEIEEKLKNHEILRYYSLETLTKEKIEEEVARLDKLIKNQDINPIHPDNPLYLKEVNRRKKVEEQLQIVFDYILLRDIKQVLENISKYYDVKTLTQIKINSELKRLKEEIKVLTKTLIYLEKKEPDNLHKMDLYIEREVNKGKLNLLNEYREVEKFEKLMIDRKDSKLRNIYGKLPKWRIEQFRKRKF